MNGPVAETPRRGFSFPACEGSKGVSVPRIDRDHAHAARREGVCVLHIDREHGHIICREGVYVPAMVRQHE